MREFIVENFTDVQTLSVYVIIVNYTVSSALALFIMYIYKITYSGTAYSRKFNISLGMITIITTMIMSVISNNIALSLGMVGALSIIRFRTAIKDIRDAVYIFWSIAVGIGCGVAQYPLVGIGSFVLFFFLVSFKQVIPDNKRLLIIQGELEIQNSIEAMVSNYFDKSAHLTMKNASHESCEFVFSISEGALMRAKNINKIDIVEKLMKLEGIHNVNLVEQIDDIGR